MLHAQFALPLVVSSGVDQFPNNCLVYPLFSYGHFFAVSSYLLWFTPLPTLRSSVLLLSGYVLNVSLILSPDNVGIRPSVRVEIEPLLFDYKELTTEPLTQR